MSDLKRRYLHDAVGEDIASKMVFVGGPRQVGKTTLAKMMQEGFTSPVYLNWDSRNHRKTILKQLWSPDSDLIVFDELHKYAKWKSFIKGIWDTRAHGEQVIVTGSSRLDTFRRGGDSLMGRYHYYRLHPFSLPEICSEFYTPPVFSEQPPDLRFPDGSRDALRALFRFGGFPEPFLCASERGLKRWQRERFERVFREDIRDTEPIRSLSQVELLGAMIPERVASPLSINSLSEDIEASPKTVKQWIELLCRNYYIFKVPPWHRRLDRALKKEAKYYLWDWSEVPSEGARFENMVASHLLKWCHYHQDRFGIGVELYYVRDLEKREVDFLVVWERQPWLLVECKLEGDRSFSSLAFFSLKLGVKRSYLVSLHGHDDYEDRRTGVRVIPVSKFLMALV